MDQDAAAAAQFRALPKTAGDFERARADTLTSDDSRRRDNVLRHVVRAIRDELQFRVAESSPLYSKVMMTTRLRGSRTPSGVGTSG